MLHAGPPCSFSTAARPARCQARAKPVPGVLGAGAGGVDLKWGIQCRRHMGTRVIYPLNLWLYSMLSGFEYQLFEVSADAFHCWVRLGSSCFIIPSPDMMERHLWHDPEKMISRASWRGLISDYQREGISSIFSLFGMIQIYPDSQGRKQGWRIGVSTEWEGLINRGYNLQHMMKAIEKCVENEMKKTDPMYFQCNQWLIYIFIYIYIFTWW